MKRCLRSHAIRLTLLFLLGIVSSVPVWAQASPTREEGPTLQALLTEVRALRQTLQRTGLNAYRSQIILEGLRVQHGQVERLGRELEETREQAEKVENTIPAFEEQAKLMEAQVARGMDVDKRAQLEYELKQRKLSVDRYKVILERLKEREARLSTQLRLAQSRETELENRLEGLEREIENEIQRLRTENRTP